jgi:hypothetical protein
MRRNAKSITTSPEIVEHIDGLTEANFKLLTMLVPWLDAKEKEQRKFRNAVLIRLSSIETKLTEVQGCQLARLSKTWPLNTLNNEQLTEYFQGVEERVSIASNQLGERMVRYIYGATDEAVVPPDRRKKWLDWEI